MSWRGPGADPEDRAPPGEAPCWLPISPLQSSEEEAPTHLSTAGQRRAAERWGVGAGGANPNTCRHLVTLPELGLRCSVAAGPEQVIKPGDSVYPSVKWEHQL